MTSSQWELKQTGAYWTITYAAMASRCEVLAVCANASEAEEVASLAFHETARIEGKFSRYRDDNIVHAINHCDGKPIRLDDETARLLRYAEQCYELSGGLFDVTSGVLRRAWRFDGGSARPDVARIRSLVQRVGWHRVEFDGDSIRMAPGMEIDLGGIGKEYAADRVADMLADGGHVGLMVNLGGDIRVLGGMSTDRPWTIGIEDPSNDGQVVGQVELESGAVASSGDARRFCYVDGIRLGHILDPRTGWPVAGAPHSTTVVSETCTAAGLMATLAMLHGEQAETFLDAQGVTYHCIR